MTDRFSRDVGRDATAGGEVADDDVRPLPVGHLLGDLQIEEIVGIGGFGIVYRAFDRTLRRVVAVKEYMPSLLAIRGGDFTVSLRAERFAQAFGAGRSAFLNEARLLAQFEHPGLIKVLHFWERHGTAYMVTPFYEGRTLKQLADGRGRMGEAQLCSILIALLSALDELHRAQCYHRDISLDNILIRPDGSPVLLDFGAARKQIGDLVDDGAMMLKPGYAPIEQYTDDPAFGQGPWTDLYALGAVMHAMVTGELPPAAVVRSIKDSYRPLATSIFPDHDRYSPAFLSAIDHALQLRIADRPQSAAEFAAELGIAEFESAALTPTEQGSRADLPDAPVEAEPVAEAAAAANATAEQASEPPAIASESSEPGGHSTPQPRRWRVRRSHLYSGCVLLAALLIATGVVHWRKPAGHSAASTSISANVPRSNQVSAAPPNAAAASVPLPREVTQAAVQVASATSPAAASASAALGTNLAPAGSLDTSEAVVAGPASGLAAQAAAASNAAPARYDPSVAATVPVRFRIQPWGDIVVNGVRRGASPPIKMLALPPGTYQIEIRNGTFPPLQRTLKIEPGGKPVSIDYAFG
ncbi:serine/threonine protein kinase [Trinickia sp. LjRoot230]|uniref:serine/threonine protein kinase n=1 Tax=Trinickia sp. LjRoot230 TaxID=3342288 RepID=UPI003ED16164